jgi:hypothetical protein
MFEIDYSLEDKVNDRKEELMEKIEARNKEIKKKLEPFQTLIVKLFEFKQRKFEIFEKVFQPVAAGEYYFQAYCNSSDYALVAIGKFEEQTRWHFFKKVKVFVPNFCTYYLDENFSKNIYEDFSFDELQELFEFLKGKYYELLEMQLAKIDLKEAKLSVDLSIPSFTF